MGETEVVEVGGEEVRVQVHDGSAMAEVVTPEPPEVALVSNAGSELLISDTDEITVEVAEHVNQMKATFDADAVHEDSPNRGNDENDCRSWYFVEIRQLD